MKRKLLLVLAMCLTLSIGCVLTGCDNLISNHKISFDTLGYGTIQTQVREAGQPVIEPEAPEREGYTFAGWTFNGELFDFSTFVSGDMTLIAKWEANTDTPYTVEHYLLIEGTDGVLVEQDTQHLTGTTDTLTQAVAKEYEGYAVVDFEQINIEGNGSTVVKIYYSEIYYSVVINTNGGSEIAPLRVKHGQTISGLESERVGYTLQWDYNFELPVTSDLTINAIWTANTNTAYRVEHYQQNVADDDYVLAETENLTGTTDTLTQVVAKDYVGFTAKAFEQAVIKGDGSVVVKIYYDRMVYSITIDEMGGSEVPDATIRHGGYISVPVSQKLGYELVAWLSNGENYDFNNPVTQSLTLVAKWEARTDIAYRVEHYQQNVADDDYVLAETENLTGATDALTAAVAKDYVGFTAKAFEQAVIKGDGSVVVKIYYDRNVYSLTFDANGGSAVDGMQVKHGTIISAPATTRTNYVFLGWYFNGEIVDFGAEITQDMQIVASWVECIYTVKHYQQVVSGEGYELFESEKISAEPESTTNAVAKEYVGFTAKAFEQKTVLTDGSTVVEIYYDRMLYSVTFNANGGSEVESVSGIRHGATISAPESSKVGYTLSWDYDFANAITADLTVNAIWTAISVNVTFTYIDGSSEVIAAIYDAGLATAPKGNPEVDFEYLTKLNGVVVDSIADDYYKTLLADTSVSYELEMFANMYYNGQFVMTGGNAYSSLYSASESFYISADFAPMSQYSKPGFAILDANGNYLRIHAKNNNTLNYYRNNSSAWIDRSVGALGVTYSAGMTYKMGLIWDAKAQCFYILINDNIREEVPLAVVLSDMSAYYGETITYDLSSVRVGLSHHDWSGANEGAVVSGLTLSDDDAAITALVDDKYFEYGTSKLNGYLAYDGVGTFNTGNGGGGKGTFFRADGSFMISADFAPAQTWSKLGFMVTDKNGVSIGFHAWGLITLNYNWMANSHEGLFAEDGGIKIAKVHGISYNMALVWDEADQTFYVYANGILMETLPLSGLEEQLSSFSAYGGKVFDLDFSSATVGLSNHGWGVAGDVINNLAFEKDEANFQAKLDAMFTAKTALTEDNGTYTTVSGGSSAPIYEAEGSFLISADITPSNEWSKPGFVIHDKAGLAIGFHAWEARTLNYGYMTNWFQGILGTENALSTSIDRKATYNFAMKWDAEAETFTFYINGIPEETLTLADLEANLNGYADYNGIVFDLNLSKVGVGLSNHGWGNAGDVFNNVVLETDATKFQALLDKSSAAAYGMLYRNGAFVTNKGGAGIILGSASGAFTVTATITPKSANSRIGFYIRDAKGNELGIHIYDLTKINHCLRIKWAGYSYAPNKTAFTLTAGKAFTFKLQWNPTSGILFFYINGTYVAYRTEAQLESYLNAYDTSKTHDVDFSSVSLGISNYYSGVAADVISGFTIS